MTVFHMQRWSRCYLHRISYFKLQMEYWLGLITGNEFTRWRTCKLHAHRVEAGIEPGTAEH